MFGRRKRAEAAAEAVREVERHALFAKLAERPEHICPFLGLAGERAGYVDGVSDEHRCYAFGDPAPLSAEQQTRVCQERGYGNCPRYLRGVLVIPTEELEALRRPRAAVAPPPPRPFNERRERRRAPLLAILALLLLVGAGAAMAWALFGGALVAGPVETSSPTPAQSVAPTSAPPSEAPTLSAAPSETPLPTRTPDPTPQPEDVFAFYEVQVNPDDYVLYEVSESGEIVRSLGATFSTRSQARVLEITAPNGVHHWRTDDQSSDYFGLSYISPNSGPFEIWAVYTRPDGERSSEPLGPNEL